MAACACAAQGRPLWPYDGSLVAQPVCAKTRTGLLGVLLDTAGFQLV